MPSPPIVFKKQVLDPQDEGEPIVLLPAAELGPGAGEVVRLIELDTFVYPDTLVRVQESTKDRVLAAFRVRSEPIGGTDPPQFRWSTAEVDKEASPYRKRVPGILHGTWSDGVSFEHSMLSATEHEIRGVRGMSDREVSLTPRMLDDRTVEIDWKDPWNSGGALLTLGDDDNILHGHYSLAGEDPEEMKKRRDRLVFWERASRYDPGEPPAGVERSVLFEGASPGPGGDGPRFPVWIPVEELHREFYSALVLDGRTRRADDKVYLEIGYSVSPAGSDSGAPAPIHCELALPYDREATQEMAEQSIFFHGVLFEWQIYGAPRDKLGQKMAPLARLLGEDPNKGWKACPRFTKHWKAGKAAGAKERASVHESLALQYASGGESLDSGVAENPFPETELAHWEIEWFHRDLPKLRPAEGTPPEEQHPTWRSYLRGRQLWKLQQEGARSVSPEIPEALLIESLLTGLEIKSVKAFFRAGWAAAIDDKMHALVKVFASMGYTENMPNPFLGGDDDVTRQLCRDFDLAQKLLREGKHKDAFAQGEALARIFAHGQRVGRGRLPNEREKLPDLIRKERTLANVEQSAAEEMYEQGLAQGQALRKTLTTQAFFRDNAGRFAPIILGFCRSRIEDHDDREMDSDTLEAASRWPAIAGLREELLDAGGSAEIFDASVKQALAEAFPLMVQQLDQTWLDAIGHKLFNIGEWLGGAFWALLDTIEWPVAKLAGWRTWENSTEWVEMCHSFEYSAFRSIRAGDGLLSLWGHAFLGISESFLLVGGVYQLGRAAAVSLWRTGFSAFSWRSLSAAMTRGGARWSARNLATALGFNAGLSLVVGVGEEAIDAFFEERDWEIDNILAATLRNSVIFAGFGLLRGVYGAAGLTRIFDRSAMALFGMAFAQVGLRYAAARKEGDEAARTEQKRAFFQLALMTLLLVGVLGISEYCARRAARSKARIDVGAFGDALGEPPAIPRDVPMELTLEQVILAAEVDTVHGTGLLIFRRDIVIRGADGVLFVIERNLVTLAETKGGRTIVTGGVSVSELRCLSWYARAKGAHVVSRRPPEQGYRRSRRVGNTSDGYEYSGGMPRNIDVYTPVVKNTGTIVATLRKKLSPKSGQTTHVIVDLGAMPKADLPIVRRFLENLLRNNRSLGRQVDVILTGPGLSRSSTRPRRTDLSRCLRLTENLLSSACSGKNKNSVKFRVLCDSVVRESRRRWKDALKPREALPPSAPKPPYSSMW
ncbi:MAG: hypothetical protein R3B70_07630 [Polyangiaceae bacterium]